MSVSQVSFFSVIVLVLSLCTSCGKQKDLVRITGVEVSIHNFKIGPNSQCLDLNLEENYLDNSPLIVKFNFMKEYYSDDESSSRFARMSISGLRGSKEKIKQVTFRINNQEIALTDLIGVDSISGYFSKDSYSGICQDSNCKCHLAYTVSSFDSLIHAVNNNLLIGDLNYNVLSDYDRDAPFVFIIPNSLLSENSKSITMNTRMMMDDGKVLTHSSNTLNVVSEL